MNSKWGLIAIGVLGLIWNAMGGMNFFMQLSPEMMAQMPEGHRVISAARPSWATATFGVSIIFGVIGCILLLLKKPIAATVLAISFIATLITVGQMLIANNITQAPIAWGAGEIALAVAGPVLVSAFLAWYAKRLS